MPFNQDLLELASAKINLALQKMLATDPANIRYIAKLEGIKIKIDCTQPAFVFLIEFKHNQVNLKKLAVKEKPDTEAEEQLEETELQISGTAINLLKLATKPIDNASGLGGSNVSVSGDVGLLLEFSQVAKMIEIDWELLLSEQIGETPAVLISRTISTGLREARKLHEAIYEKAVEKMHSENSPLPNKTELAQLKSRLRDLNYRLDRLEATSGNQAGK